MSIRGGLALKKPGYCQDEVVTLNHKGICRDVLLLGSEAAVIRLIRHTGENIQKRVTQPLPAFE